MQLIMEELGGGDREYDTKNSGKKVYKNSKIYAVMIESDRTGQNSTDFSRNQIDTSYALRTALTAREKFSCIIGSDHCRLLLCK